MDWRKAVEDAARLMDQHFPGWHHKINAATLAINSCELCIIGQYFGRVGYLGHTMVTMGILNRSTGVWTYPHQAFWNRDARDFWLHEIAVRLAVDPKVPNPEPEPAEEEPELVPAA